MKVLLTNDDGIRAPGIKALWEELVSQGIARNGDVLTVAPLSGQSATSHGVTYQSPLFAYDVTISEELHGFGVEGLPADCVKLALHSLCDEYLGGPPDLVISGMNAGANAGINTVYSGTVAAALEAALQGVPSMAVSLLLEDWEKARYDVAARHACHVIEKCLANGPLDPHESLNINLPATESDCTTPEMRVTTMNLGSHHDRYERRHSPRGNPYFWATGSGLDFKHTTPDSDVAALSEGKISVTPIHFDFTRREAIDRWKLRLPDDPT